MIALLGMGFDDRLCWLIFLPALAIMGYRTLIRSEDRSTLLTKWGFSVLLILSIVWIASWHSPAKPLWVVIPCTFLGIMWISNAFNFLLKPFTDAFDGGTEEVDLKPYYFTAEGKRRKGLYAEAIAEVRKELEKFPGDIEGLMKLAALQAEDLHDLPAATATLNELLQQPGLPSSKAVAALQTLADWQMKFGRDPAAARASFERIIQMFPDSSLSHTAEQRIAHLDRVNETREFRENAVFKVPSGERGLGLRQTAAPPESPEAEADALAAEYVRQLEKYPTDTETREKLAMLYAGQFERLDLAVSQLEQLIALPNETPQHIAHWLGILATLHICHGHDMEAAENALRRIIDRFPNSAAATRAVARLATLQGELKANATPTAAKALGVYEKDLGLKSRSSI
jgi:tetratricopeptide (TPR) repeat protein